MSESGIGARVERKEDKRFITGKGRYTDDFKVEGMSLGNVFSLILRNRSTILAGSGFEVICPAVSVIPYIWTIGTPPNSASARSWSVGARSADTVRTNRSSKRISSRTAQNAWEAAHINIRC